VVSPQQWTSPLHPKIIFPKTIKIAYLKSQIKKIVIIVKKESIPW